MAAIRGNGAAGSTRQNSHHTRFTQESDKKVPCGCCFGATPPYLNPAIVAIVGGIFLEAIAVFVLFYLITEEGRYFIIMNVVFHMTAALWLIAGTLLIYRRMRAKCLAAESADAHSEPKLGDQPATEPMIGIGPSRHSIHRYYPTLFAQQAMKQQINNNYPAPVYHTTKYSVLHRQDVFKMPTAEDPYAKSNLSQLESPLSGGGSARPENPTASFSSLGTFEGDRKTRQMF